MPIMPPPPSSQTPLLSDHRRAKPLATKRWLMDIASVGILVLTAAWLSWSSGSFTANMTHHPDEPAHFITGLMVYDYLASAAGRNPLDFAEKYYTQYPKVALGHWPPLFYLFEAAGFAVLGAGKAAALILVSLCAAAVAILVYERCRREDGPMAALVMALIFLALPLARAQATAVLSETFLCLLSLLATFAFADFLTDGKSRHLAAFGAWSTLALLTKGNGLALGLLPGLAILLTGRWDLFRSRRLWLTGLAVVLISAPYYVLTYRMRSQSFFGEWSAGYMAGSFAFYGSHLMEALGAGLALVCGVGALVAMRSAPVDGPTLMRRTCLAWALSVLLFQAVFPVGREVRFLLLALPPVLLLGARGVCLVVGGTLQALSLSRPVVTALVGLLLLATLPGRLPPQIHGYEAVAAAIPEADGPSVALISSSSIGEGALIVERRLRDPQRRSYTLRASKELGQSTWIGGAYQSLFASENELREHLLQSAIRYIIIDDFGSRLQPEEPHQELLRKAVRGAPETFVLRQVVAMQRGDQTEPHGVYVYENTSAAGRIFEPPTIDIRRKFGGT